MRYKVETVTNELQWERNRFYMGRNQAAKISPENRNSNEKALI